MSLLIVASTMLASSPAIAGDASVRFETQDSSHVFSVSVHTAQGDASCSAPVSFLHPCELNLASGEARITTQGSTKATLIRVLPPGQSVVYLHYDRSHGEFVAGGVLFTLGAVGLAGDSYIPNHDTGLYYVLVASGAVETAAGATLIAHDIFRQRNRAIVESPSAKLSTRRWAVSGFANARSSFLAFAVTF